MEQDRSSEKTRERIQFRAKEIKGRLIDWYEFEQDEIDLKAILTFIELKLQAEYLQGREDERRLSYDHKRD